ncbi:MAG: ABC-ATPase domain-containing protein [Clostridiales bacterium]|nr:ABC-ATPase domain-containing protein [Clostridiales bacterium]
MMRSQAELKKQLREIDHKGYKAYKVLEGEYDFGAYRLAIDHVQGDPFATPSRVRIIYHNHGSAPSSGSAAERPAHLNALRAGQGWGNIAPQYFESRHRRIAVEDYLLRRLHRNLRAESTSRPAFRQDVKAFPARFGRQGGRTESGQGYRGNRENREDRGRRDEQARDYNGNSGRAGRGSGKSGLVTACRAGQEVLERTAMCISVNEIEARIEVGFPAFGRTIAAGELEKILFDFLPEAAEKTFHFNPQMKRELDAVVELADDQQYIRDALDGLGLVAFVADGSVLPRESGVSQRPMKSLETPPRQARRISRPEGEDAHAPQSEIGGITRRGQGGAAVKFESPESLAVTLELPHRGSVRGMGIKKGVTVIAGGGFHGKSTLLKALERGVYNHIAGDGRELVITDQSAFKLRAEEGRCIHETDISMFISNLPTRADTTRFSTENASGSTSQAANTVEALAADSRLLLIDEDTSATNFMVRDERMAQLVSDEKEPIKPFIRSIRSLYEDLGVSTILVVGSSGDYLTVADTVLQMDCYVAKDVTARAKEICGQQYEGVRDGMAQDVSGQPDKETMPGTANVKRQENSTKNLPEMGVKSREAAAQRTAWLKKPVRAKQIEKARTHGWDTLSLDKTEIDLRYLEQVVDESQTAALAYLMQYILGRMADGKKTAAALAEEAARKIEKDGILSVTPKNYGAGAAASVRRQEILACLARYRML